uniref:Fluoride-specific ion channel FluC n=1 Tax=Fervidobacterium nodosum TaxID=2424 RepID=A0A7C5U4P4_9BACT
MDLSRIFAVGIGGFLGSVARYLISLRMNEMYPESFIPYGTLIVNVVGSFLLGVIMELSVRSDMNTTLRLFLSTGIMGGLTTFSTMSYETIALLTSSQYLYAVLNITLNLIFGLSAGFVGKILIDVLI